jgi:hypothetical protein
MEIARRRFRADLAQQRLLVAPPVLERLFKAPENYWFNMEPPKVFERWMPCSWRSLLICANSGKSVCSLAPIKGSVEWHPWLVVWP